MTDETLPADRANRIADAVEAIERNVSQLRNHQQLSHEEYTSSDEQDRRDAIERKFVKLAEATVDMSERLRTAVGFRDVLAHTYGPIVNDDIVYDALQNDLERYVDFVKAVDGYLN